jgi:hypothetical protein
MIRLCTALFNNDKLVRSVTAKWRLLVATLQNKYVLSLVNAFKHVERPDTIYNLCNSFNSLKEFNFNN